MKLKNMRIRPRLMAGFLVPGLIYVLLLILAICSSVSMQRHYEAIMDNQVQLQMQILNARVNINTAARYVRDMALDTEKTNYSSNQQHVDTALSSLEESTDYISAHMTDETATEFLNAVSNWENAVPSILSAIERGDFSQADRLLREQCTPALNAEAQAADNLTTFLNTEINTTLASQNRAFFLSVLLIVIALVCVIIGVFLFSRRVIVSFVHPLKEVQTAITEMSKGKLDVPVTYQSKDELGDIAQALRISQKVLQSVIAEIDRTTTEMSKGNFDISIESQFPGALYTISESITKMVYNLNTVLNRIKNMVGSIASSAAQVASGSQSLAQGATEQASAVQELSATINDISFSSSQNAESAKIAKDNTDKAGAQNTTSKEKMHEMICAMDEITATSKEIRKIIKTIEDIAFQTNILALNAAIEAARAGSAGKGFAVVADEVRNLASKSAEAAKNTTVLIEDSIRAVENGSNIAHSAADSIESSVALTDQAVQQITQIASEVERESDAIGQITQGIDQISTVVQTNSATSQESAAASQELSALASSMRQLLNEFKTAARHSETEQRWAPSNTGMEKDTPPSISYVSSSPTPETQATTHYELTPDLETGNDLIDSEHRELFHAINNLLDACAGGKGRGQITSTVDFLTDYVDKHFADEEALQKDYKYPNYTAHQKFHIKYKSEIRQMGSILKAEGPTMKNLGQVNQLIGILVNHIRQEDKRLAAYIKSAES